MDRPDLHRLSWALAMPPVCNEMSASAWRSGQLLSGSFRGCCFLCNATVITGQPGPYPIHDGPPTDRNRLNVFEKAATFDLTQLALIAQQSDRLHELNSIAGLNNPGLELEIEDELSVLQVIFEVIIPRASIHALGNVRER